MLGVGRNASPGWGGVELSEFTKKNGWGMAVQKWLDTVRIAKCTVRIATPVCSVASNLPI